MYPDKYRKSVSRFCAGGRIVSAKNGITSACDVSKDVEEYSRIVKAIFAHGIATS